MNICKKYTKINYFDLKEEKYELKSQFKEMKLHEARIFFKVTSSAQLRQTSGGFGGGRVGGEKKSHFCESLILLFAGVEGNFFCPHPYKLLILSHPENFVKIGLIVQEVIKGWGVKL